MLRVALGLDQPQVIQAVTGSSTGSVHYCDLADAWHHFLEQLQPFSGHGGWKVSKASSMTTRASHADDEAVAHWIGNEQEYDWLCAGLVKDILDGWNSTSSILLMRQICKIRWIVGVEAWIAGWFFRMLGAHSYAQ